MATVDLFAIGNALIVTVVLAVDEQFVAELVPMTVYVVKIVGVAMTVAP